METPYDNFDLLIKKEADGYRALILDARFGKTKSTSFTLPFTQEQLTTFFWLSGRTRNTRPLHPKSTPAVALTPREFGEELYLAVFNEPLHTNLALSYHDARKRQTGLRIRLCFDANVAELADLPWEFLWAPDPMNNDFLALQHNTPLVRYPQVDAFNPSFTVTPPLRILVMLSDPRDVTPLDVEEEFLRLQEALGKLLASNAIELERLEEATLEALHERLRSGEFHVFHFIGHGFFDEITNQGGLIFEDKAGNAHEVSAEQLWNELRGEETLRLIYLNACEGARSGRDDFFAGVAQQLVQKGVPAVLAMQFEVSDRAAITLAQAFYQKLAEGHPLDTALVEARVALNRAGNEMEWATPVLFSRQADLSLLGTAGANDGPAYSGPTHPRSKAELQSLDLRIPDRAVVHDMLFAPRTLTTGERVTLEQPVYAQGDIRIGKASHAKSHLYAGGSIFLDAGVIVDGDIFVKGAQLVLGDGCVVRGSVQADQTVTAAARCQLAGVRALHVELGRRCKVGSLWAGGGAILEDGVALGACHIERQLILRPGSNGIDIQTRTLTAGSIEWPEGVNLRLAGLGVDRSNLFLWQDAGLLPGPAKPDAVNQPFIITTLLSAGLAAAIQECTTATLYLPVASPRPGQVHEEQAS